jgi:hypothetical protein
MTDAPKQPSKVTLVYRVATLNAKPGDKVKVDRETADQLIANNQAREV